MKFKVSAKTAMRYVKYFVEPILCWPPPLSASKTHLFIRDILLFISALSPTMWIYPLFMTVTHSEGNFTRATKNMSIIIAFTFTIFKMCMCRYHRAKFQVYVAELNEFVKMVNERENAILERYMDKCGSLYTFVGVAAIATAASIVAGPIILPQRIPFDVILPFEWEDSLSLTVIIYFFIIGVSSQAVSAVIVDMEVALLLWFSGIRFELLAEDFMMATTLSELHSCIQRHQKLVASGDELISTVRYIILTVVIITTLGNICTGYQFVHHQPLAVLAQFFFMLSVMSMEVLMYAWPADNLMATSENIAYAAYSSQWFGKSPEISKSIQIVMLRAQKPLVISVAGLLPALNLDFYGKYLTTSFSYFTTLQAVAG